MPLDTIHLDWKGLVVAMGVAGLVGFGVQAGLIDASVLEVLVRHLNINQQYGWTEPSSLSRRAGTTIVSQPRHPLHIGLCLPSISSKKSRKKVGGWFSSRRARSQFQGWSISGEES